VLEDRQKVIRVTLANGSFESVFQPIVELGSGGAVGAEALTRFETTPIRPPDVWFAEAREVGLGVELEMAALRSALGQLGRLPSGLYLSLNASPDTMMSPEFLALVAGAPAERVVLELTEHDSIDDYELFENAVNELRSNGVRLAVDDAGSGYSSFRHILNLRPDIIKLDITLTRGIDGDPARRALGSALLTFGLDAYNASIVAEGIETEAEFKTLRGLGCRFGQGYYLGRPGRLKSPRPQSQGPQQLWLGNGPEAQSRSAQDPVETDDETRPEPSPGTKSVQQQVPASVGDPVRETAGQERASRRQEQSRDNHNELLALVAEIQARPKENGHAWKGDRSRADLLRRR